LNIEVKAVPFERWELSVPYSTLFVIIFSSQAEVIIGNPLHIVLIAVVCASFSP